VGADGGEACIAVVPPTGLFVQCVGTWDRAVVG